MQIHYLSCTRVHAYLPSHAADLTDSVLNVMWKAQQTIMVQLKSSHMCCRNRLAKFFKLSVYALISGCFKDCQQHQD